MGLHLDLGLTWFASMKDWVVLSSCNTLNRGFAINKAGIMFLEQYIHGTTQILAQRKRNT